MNNSTTIKLYGSAKCHKTLYYKNYFDRLAISFEFLDVVVNSKHAIELRSLYESGKLNFPTITIGNKKLRNPSDKELEKWLNKFNKELWKIIKKHI